jgi:hypothetical protein
LPTGKAVAGDRRHAAVDFAVTATSLLLGRSLGTTLMTELLVAVLGGLTVWIVWRLRERYNRKLWIGAGLRSAAYPLGC